MATKKKRQTVSPGSLSPAVPNDKATDALHKKIAGAVKKSGMSGSELHLQTGISLAMSRRIVRGDKTDMKISTLARLLACKKIGLEMKQVA